MPRLIRRWLTYLPVPAAAGALLALGLAAGPASAAPAPGTPISHSPTAACVGEFGSCPEPVVAEAVPAALSLNPADDAAMTVTGPAGRVSIDAVNDEQDGSQDWQSVQIATVPHPGGGPGAFGFTGFDRHNYGGDGVWIVEWTPFGFDTGACAQVVGALHKIALRPCDGGADQAFIIHHGPIPLAGFPASPAYVWALGVQQAVNAQHHLALTAPGSVLAGNQLQMLRPVHVAPGHLDRQSWSATS